MRPSATPSTSTAGEELRYRGVRKRKWGKYVSEIRLPNSRERIWLGSYDTAKKAARAFDAALFCLRGKNAKFNFPDAPPPADIAPDGSPLGPAEIQAISARFANGGDGSNSAPAGEGGSSANVESMSPSSGSDTTVDWSSYLDTLEPAHAGNSSAGGAGIDRGFGEFDDFGNDIYAPAAASVELDLCPIEYDMSFTEHYFLWNFQTTATEKVE